MRQCLALPEMHGILPTRPASAGHLLPGLIAPCSWPWGCLLILRHLTLPRSWPGSFAAAWC